MVMKWGNLAKRSPKRERGIAPRPPGGLPRKENEDEIEKDAEPDAQLDVRIGLPPAPTPPLPKKAIARKRHVPEAFGPILKFWRSQAHMSQTELAVSANVSSRHVSFMETSRARPSRKMVLKLAEVLGLPLRQRNAMLEAAEYPHVFPETAMGAPALIPAERAVVQLLNMDVTRPAVAYDRRWNIYNYNDAFGTLFEALTDQPRPSDHESLNFIRLLVGEEYLRPYIENWSELSINLLRRVHQAATLAGSDPSLMNLVEEVMIAIESYEGGEAPKQRGNIEAVVPIRFSGKNFSASLFSTMTTIAAPRDVTLAELTVEIFHPSDATSNTALSDLMTQQDDHASD